MSSLFRLVPRWHRYGACGDFGINGRQSRDGAGVGDIRPQRLLVDRHHVRQVRIIIVHHGPTSQTSPHVNIDGGDRDPNCDNRKNLYTFSERTRRWL